MILGRVPTPNACYGAGRTGARPWRVKRWRRPKHRTRKTPPVADAKGTSSLLILNPAAGSAPTLTESLTRAARERGIGMRVLEPGEDAMQAALEAAEDGVESVAVERDLSLVVVPTGTLNHFARDLGLDLARPLAALDVLTSSHHERRVDVGRINGRCFINNVSLGLYAEMLADPGYRQDKLGVAQAKLQASVLDASTLDELERLIAGTLLGAMEFRPALRHWTSERLETGVPGEVVRAGVDGEPVALEAPLRFSVDPAALRVLVPAGAPAKGQTPPLEAGLHAARTLRRWLRPTPAPKSEGDNPHEKTAHEIAGLRKPLQSARRGGPDERRSRRTEDP